MSAAIFPNGIGGLLGDELVITTELYTTGNVYYVHHTGDNANVGTSRQKPLATFSHANDQMEENDIIVFLDGHAETLTATVRIIRAGVRVVAEGTVELTSGLSDQSSVTLEETNITLGGIRFPEGGTLATVAKIEILGERAMIRDCYFEAGAGDQFALVRVGDESAGARFFRTAFVSVSTTEQPAAALATGAAPDLELEACTLDGGDTNFSLGALYSGSIPARFRGQQMRLLNGASIIMDGDTTGYIGVAESTGAPRIDGFPHRLAEGFRQTGDALLADQELYFSGDIFYVQYDDGDDANSGIDELNPKKTISGAISVLSKDCSFVVCLPGHVEPLSGAIDLNSTGVTLIGCGTADGNPGCRVYQASGGPFVDIQMSQVSYVRNLWIDATPTAVTQTRQVTVPTEFSEIRGCLVRSMFRDTIGIFCSASFTTFRETTFEAADSAGGANRVTAGLEFNGGEGSLTDIDVRGCIFSNGVHGYKTAGLWGNDPVSRLYGISATLRFGANAELDSDTTGQLNPETASGSALVEW